MKDTDFLTELKVVLNAQRGIVSQIDSSIEGLGVRIESAERQAREIDGLSGLLDEIEKDAGLLSSSDLGGWEEDDARLQAICDERRGGFEAHVATLEYHNWQQFVRDSQIYCLSHGMEPLLPWEAVLSYDDFEQLKAESYESQYRWDKWDYIFVGAAGALAALTDYLLVRIPKEITYRNRFPQAGSPITAFLKENVNSEPGSNNWFARWAQGLEKTCKVPFDESPNPGLGGMGGPTHRLQTLGHDPVLGFVFGVLDILRRTISGFSYDRLTGNHVLKVLPAGDGAEVELIQAVLIQLGHLISDAGTKMGIPPPFFTLFQGINVRDPLSPKDRTIGEMARWMYLNGYDLRHFITMGITPAVIEIVLRGYVMIRHYSTHGEVKFAIAGNPKYRCMLLAAHAVACAGNGGKIALMQGNPLAINYAEWLALLRYLLPSVKYWVLDRNRLKIEHMRSTNEQAWQELCDAGDALLAKVFSRDSNILTLGAT